MIDEKGIKELVFYILDYWVGDTMVLSSGLDIKHPAFRIIQKITKLDKISTIKAILLHITEYESFSFSFLFYLLDKEELPEIPEEARGKIKILRNMYIEWGKEKGYIN